MTRLTSEQHKAAYQSVFSIGMGYNASLEKFSAELPEDAIEVISTLMNHKLPAFDIDEESPEASEEHSEETMRLMQDIDKEQFPKDLPEDLIRELLDSNKGER